MEVCEDEKCDTGERSSGFQLAEKRRKLEGFVVVLARGVQNKEKQREAAEMRCSPKMVAWWRREEGSEEKREGESGGL
ncbi:hypothetical protein HAX54_017773, partial [Datura stramonium]|nr:hypothetical protein [Datura stramonium]